MYTKRYKKRASRKGGRRRSRSLSSPTLSRGGIRL